MTAVGSAAWRSEPVQRGLQGSEHEALLTAGDAAVAAGAALLAIGLWTITAGVGLAEGLETRWRWFLVAAAWTVALTPSRLGQQALSIGTTFRSVTRVAGVLLVAYLAIYFYAPRQALPRLLAVYFAWEAGLLTLAWRLTYIWVFTETSFRRRVLVVGAGPAGEAAIRALRVAGVRDAVVVGVVDVEETTTRATVLGVPVLGGRGLLPDVAIQERVSQVILAAPTISGPVADRLLACQEVGINVVPLSTIYEQLLRRVPVAHLDSSWLFTSFAESVSAKDASRLAKRVVDVVGGMLGTGLFLLAAPFISFVIWIDSGFPIFYAQLRAGRGGRPFRILKFRTMVQDAETAGQAQWAELADSRVTRAGRWLRQARLDELPNFISVLLGHMSLVGPRPERPEFLARLEREVPLYRVRLTARPGLTGWAQINYPYGNSVADAEAKLEYDLYYLKHRSLPFDVWIVLRTIATVFTLRGR